MKTIYRTFVCKKRAGLTPLGDRKEKDAASALLNRAKEAGARYGWVEEIIIDDGGGVKMEIIETFNIVSIEAAI